MQALVPAGYNLAKGGYFLNSRMWPKAKEEEIPRSMELEDEERNATTNTRIRNRVLKSARGSARLGEKRREEKQNKARVTRN